MRTYAARALRRGEELTINYKRGVTHRPDMTQIIYGELTVARGAALQWRGRGAWLMLAHAALLSPASCFQPSTHRRRVCRAARAPPAGRRRPAQLLVQCHLGEDATRRLGVQRCAACFELAGASMHSSAACPTVPEDSAPVPPTHYKQTPPLAPRPRSWTGFGAS